MKRRMGTKGILDPMGEVVWRTVMKRNKRLRNKNTDLNIKTNVTLIFLRKIVMNIELVKSEQSIWTILKKQIKKNPVTLKLLTVTVNKT